MLHAISVDVEDYFHTEAMSSVASRGQWEAMPSRVVESTERILRIFAESNVRGTFFFLGWVAKKFPRLVRKTASYGHEIACHSFWHKAIFRLDPAEFRQDTVDAKHAIEDAAGQPIYGYRAPSFSMTPGTEWAWEVLADLGFTYDSSVNPIRHDFYGNAGAPRIPYWVASGRLMQIPIATTRLFGNNLPCGGGAYLRLFPQLFFRFALSRLEKENTPGTFYLHPWEIDEDQPRLDAPIKSRIRQYTGLGRMEPNLVALFRRYSFAPIREIYSGATTRTGGKSVAATR
jgi:polysaccharide deacetylase family protein (PEP-CTERM system associated)